MRLKSPGFSRGEPLRGVLSGEEVVEQFGGFDDVVRADAGPAVVVLHRVTQGGHAQVRGVSCGVVRGGAGEPENARRFGGRVAGQGVSGMVGLQSY